jgi:hypothetical protein
MPPLRNLKTTPRRLGSAMAVDLMDVDNAQQAEEHFHDAEEARSHAATPDGPIHVVTLNDSIHATQPTEEGDDHHGGSTPPTNEQGSSEGLPADKVKPALRRSKRKGAPTSTTITEAPAASALAQAEAIVKAQRAAQDEKIKILRAVTTAIDAVTAKFRTKSAAALLQELTADVLKHWEVKVFNGIPGKPRAAPVLPTYAAALKNNLPPSPPASNSTRQPIPPTLGSTRPNFVPPDDLRVYARLDENSPAWRHTSYSIRKAVAEALSIDQSKLPMISRTRTGWSIRAADITTRDLLITKKGSWDQLIGAVTVEKHETWYTYIVEGCPQKIYQFDGNAVPVTEAAKEDAIFQTGQTPVRVTPSRHNVITQHDCTILVSFTTPVQRKFQLFGCSKYARLVVKTPPPNQCEICWGYHSRYSCGRNARCRQCGKNGHGEERCQGMPQCVNCLGPHTADNETCQARPRRKNGRLIGLTAREKAAVRALGAQAFRNTHAERFVSPDDNRTPAPQPTPCPRPRLTVEAPDSQNKRQRNGW